MQALRGFTLFVIGILVSSAAFARQSKVKSTSETERSLLSSRFESATQYAQIIVEDAVRYAESQDWQYKFQQIQAILPQLTFKFKLESETDFDFCLKRGAYAFAYLPEAETGMNTEVYICKKLLREHNSIPCLAQVIIHESTHVLGYDERDAMRIEKQVLLQAQQSFCLAVQ